MKSAGIEAGGGLALARWIRSEFFTAAETSFCTAGSVGCRNLIPDRRAATTHIVKPFQAR